jgi:hypothetical protein
MENKKIIIGAVMAVAISITLLRIGVRHPDNGSVLVPFPENRTGNNSVYLAGCKSFHGSEPPAIVYKTVRKNFVTWPCALEVPPPDGAIKWERHSLVLK